MTCGLLKPVTSNALGLADAQSKDAAVVQLGAVGPVNAVANESAPDPSVFKNWPVLPSA